MSGNDFNFPQALRSNDARLTSCPKEEGNDFNFLQ